MLAAPGFPHVRISAVPTAPGFVPWSASRVLAYLEEHRITVRVRDGRPELVRDSAESAGRFDALVSAVLPHLSHHRAQVIEHVSRLAPGASSLPPNPRVGSAPFRRLGPRERRRVVVEHCISLAAAVGGSARCVWFSWYTKRTGHFSHPSDVDDTATRAAVVVSVRGWETLPGGRHGPAGRPDSEVFSAALPASVTPPKYREPAAGMPSDYVPGPGFKPFVESKKARGRRWWAKWKTDAYFADSCPPD
jgi:hypothetical protein